MPNEPRNQNEEQIVRARAGMAVADRLWSSQPVTARKSDAQAAPAPASHISGMGGTTTMRSAETTIARKADTLDALPASVKERAQGFDAGQRALVAHIFSTHARTGRPVALDAGEAARLMGSTPEKATKFIAALETAGLITRAYSTLGPLIGFVPAIGA